MPPKLCCLRVNLKQDGLKAIVDLAEGDMRKCLNVMQVIFWCDGFALSMIHFVLQACHLAYKCVNEENVYLSTGNPTPAIVRQILTELLNENFQVVYNSTKKTMIDNGFALADILK